MTYIFEPPLRASVAIKDSDDRFPVHRIYCIGKNYAEHTREMGGDPKLDPPCYFSKPADAVVEDGATIAYPQGTNNLHHEIELVVALKGGGRDISVEDASDMVFGYAVGIDLTRRDLQKMAKGAGGPWDIAKGFDCSAPISAITPKQVASLSESSIIELSVNGENRQTGTIGDLIWSIEEVINSLSKLFELQPGDLIYTGTPAGVAALEPGDHVEGSVSGVGSLTLNIAP